MPAPGGARIRLVSLSNVPHARLTQGGSALAPSDDAVLSGYAANILTSRSEPDWQDRSIHLAAPQDNFETPPWGKGVSISAGGNDESV